MERIARTNVSVDSIQPGPWQPRLAMDQAKLKELASSIRQHGLIYPVMIRLVDGQQQLISGERRWRPLAWRDFVAADKPWGWPEEWPTPWVGEQEPGPHLAGP